MPRVSPRVLVVAFLTLLLVIPGAVLGDRPSVGGHPATGAGELVRGAPAAPRHGIAAQRGSRAPAVGAGIPRTRGARAVPLVPVDATGGSGLPIFPPNPQRPRAPPGLAAASNLYPSVPAPMGVSDLGVGTNGSYEYGTGSFEGNLTLTSFSAFTPTNITSSTESSPDWALWQLDAVAVNVTLPPAASERTNGTFWVQSGLHFNGTTVQLEDNVWNFSTNATSYIPPSTLSGRNGSIVDEQVYVGVGPKFSVTPPSLAHPLTIELFDNITVSSGHTVVTFGYSVGSRAGTYDVVTFNGASSGSSPSQFLVDGAQLTPSGLLYDAEFVLGGNGGGSNANLLELNGSASLRRSVSGSYAPIPSAFDFGEDTGETALGVAVAYNGTTVRLTAGPSFLRGLWATGGTIANRTAPPATPGWIRVELAVTPSYALVFATNASGASGPLPAANYSYAPTNTSGDLATDLPPPPPSDPYVFNAWADGYLNRTTGPISTTISTVLTLPASPATVNTPVYLLGTGEAVAFGQAHVSGTGYAPAAKTLWLNASQDALVAPFLRVNEMDYPTFPLVATDGVDLTLDVNGFVQAPSTFNYSNEAGGMPLELLGWGQGYFLYNEGGGVTVENLTIEGIGPHASIPVPINPPSTVEVYHSSGITAANLTANYDAIGLTLVGTGSAVVTNVLSEGGAVGVSAVRAADLTVSQSTATGADPASLIPSALLELNATSSVTATALTVSDSATGLGSQGGSGVTISQLTVASSATGLAMNDTGSSSVSGLTVEGGLASAGSWSNSTGLTFKTVTVNGTGLVLSGDSSVEVDGGSATGYGSTVVDAFNDSTEGTFVDLAATDQATAVNLVNCSDVNASGITATGQSVGAYINHAVSPSGTDYESSGLSVGLLLENSTAAPSDFSSFSVTGASIGAFIDNSTGVHLSSVNATNLTLGSASVFSNETLRLFPIAGVGLYNDNTVNITGVTALDYPYAVWANDTVELAVYDVVARYGGNAVALNWTNASRVTETFAFADAVGVSVQNCTDTDVEDSTFEASAGVGVWLTNGKGDVVEDDNFVGNNDSSVTGQFNVSHLQAYSNNTTSPTFRYDFWSDRSGSTYVINATGHTVDTTPQRSFYLPYLAFTEGGLPARVNWTVALGTDVYTTNDSVVYIPGWSLVPGTYTFTVLPARGYPPHPASGSVAWAGTSVSQAIYFGTSPSTGVPRLVWAAVGAGAAAVAAVAAVLLLSSRRRRAPPTRPPRRPLPPEARPRPAVRGHRPDRPRPTGDSSGWPHDGQG